MTQNAELAEIARQAWDLKLEEPYFRMRVGLPVERIKANTLEDAKRVAAIHRDLAKRLQTIDPAGLSTTDALTHGFMVHATRQGTNAVHEWRENFPLTPYTFSIVASVVMPVFGGVTFKDASDVERYLSLLGDYAALLRAQRQRLETQADSGWRIPVPALPTIRTTLQRTRDQAVMVFTPATERLAVLGTDGARVLTERVARLIADQITPAYNALLEAVGDDYERAAPITVGLWQYPGGDAAYRRAIENHLTLPIEPQALYQLGLDEVARITAEMARLRSRMGAADNEAEFHAALKTSPRSYAASSEALEATYRRHMGRMVAKLPEYFHRTPHSPYDVARLDPSLEAGMSFGYYDPPLSAGAPGLYYYNGSGLETRLQLNAPALIFHELAPGHHFHFALQGENGDLPPIRREFFDNVGFAEGWAEYASSLGGELGLYDDDYDHYGRLVHERFVATRLVLDTGLNALGWPLDQARAYMSQQTLESDQLIAGETLRYATDMPGQALGYQFGCLKFWELRRRAADLAGSAFDIRDFHEAVLGQGCLPFALLEGHIDRIFSRQ